MANNTIKLKYEDIADASLAEMSSGAREKIGAFRSKHYRNIGKRAIGSFFS